MRAFAGPYVRRPSAPTADRSVRRAALSLGVARLGGAAVVAAALALGGRTIVSRVDDARWIVVARDSSYTISIDTTRIVRAWGRTYEVWYRTDHAVTRFYKEKSFTRETVHAILRCDGYLFRVASVEMSMGSSRPVARQVSEQRDVLRQPWRQVEAGSTEADAARATCQVADWLAAPQN